MQTICRYTKVCLYISVFTWNLAKNENIHILPFLKQTFSSSHVLTYTFCFMLLYCSRFAKKKYIYLRTNESTERQRKSEEEKIIRNSEVCWEKYGEKSSGLLFLLLFGMSKGNKKQKKNFIFERKFFYQFFFGNKFLT